MRFLVVTPEIGTRRYQIKKRGSRCAVCDSSSKKCCVKHKCWSWKACHYHTLGSAKYLVQSLQLWKYPKARPVDSVHQLKCLLLKVILLLSTLMYSLLNSYFFWVSFVWSAFSHSNCDKIPFQEALWVLDIQTIWALFLMPLLEDSAWEWIHFGSVSQRGSPDLPEVNPFSSKMSSTFAWIFLSYACVSLSIGSMSIHRGQEGWSNDMYDSVYRSNLLCIQESLSLNWTK